MPKPEPIRLVFSLERDTKNKVRFQEMQPVEGTKAAQPTPKDEAVVEKLYLSKKFLKKHGNPDVVHVVIEFP